VDNCPRSESETSLLSVLREQPDLFGEVASFPTAWRVIAAITPERLGVLREARRRAGNAGANTAADHIAGLQQAMEQLPEPAWGMEILGRADSGGATHDFVNDLRAFEIRFSLTGHLSPYCK
jgi:hypothetical protein